MLSTVHLLSLVQPHFRLEERTANFISTCIIPASRYRGSTKMDIHGGVGGRYCTTGLHVQDPRRYNDRRCRRSQATQPRGTGSSYRAEVRRKFMPPLKIMDTTKFTFIARSDC